MTQNIISLNITDADPDGHRRSTRHLGSEARPPRLVLAQNTPLLPPSFDLADAQNDLAQLEKLRPRAARLRRLLERADDGETALGSDVMSAALEGYAMLKVSGKGAGLDALRQGMSARFTRKAKVNPPVA
jgi:hypothetical protein